LETLQAVVNNHRIDGDIVGNKPFYSNYMGSPSWGKCVINDEDSTVEFMQTPGTCKDYVVDTYYRSSSHGYQASYWTDEQRAYPSMYLWMNFDLYKQAIKNIKEVLNPWEGKHNFIPTECFKVDFNTTELADTQNKTGRLLVMKYDPKWMTNSMTMSYFLSVMRHSILQGTTDFSKYTDYNYNMPEYNYYNREPNKPFRKVFDYIHNNPNHLIEFLKDATFTGYKRQPDSHGCTGLFYISQYLYYKYQGTEYYMNQWKELDSNIRNHALIGYFEHVMELLSPKKEELPNVKMQSLQPKTPRARTSKKTATPAAVDIWPDWAREITIGVR